MNQVYIGTSGWSYKGWEKAFYPHDLPKTEQFEFYATQFPTVEINLTFYRLPTSNMVRGWRAKAPPGFVYAIKGSRYITHMKKLRNLDYAGDKFFDHIRPLKKRIGVILWQLPPFMEKDTDRLEADADGSDSDSGPGVYSLSWFGGWLRAQLHTPGIGAVGQAHSLASARRQ